MKLHNLFRILALALGVALLGCQSQQVQVAPPAAETVAPTVAPMPTENPTSTAVATAAMPAVTATPPEMNPALAEPTVTGTLPPSPIPTVTPVPAVPAASITLVPVVEGGFTRPLYLTHAQDERLFVVEEAGIIRIIRDGRLVEQPFLDIRDRVNSTALERGLLGLAFHPQYDENGFFYVNYSNQAGDTHVSRFSVDPADPDRADGGSERLLLTIEQPWENHNGGQIAFGPDGHLYIGVGDGGSANDPLLSGQNPGTLLGTILRIDVNAAQDGYGIPPSNPFTADAQARDEIWAFGLRNPWRFSFDRQTGDLFIADVGQNLWEEVHFQPAESTGGENYGWNILEGSHCFMSETCDATGLEMPIFEYSHAEGGCSVTGGYMHRGTLFPVLNGNYFVGDYCQGKIWRLFRGADGQWSSALLLDTGHVISSFGEDAAGEIYVLDHVSGSVFRIQP